MTQASQNRVNREFCQVLQQPDAIILDEDYCESDYLKKITCDNGDPKDLIDLGSRIPCTRHTQTIRESTCKGNPTAKRADSGYLHCPYEGCIRTYVYQGAFLTHCNKMHPKEQPKEWLVFQKVMFVVETEESIEKTIATIENSQGQELPATVQTDPLVPTALTSTQSSISAESAPIPKSHPPTDPKAQPSSQDTRKRKNTSDWTQIEDKLLRKLANYDGDKIDWSQLPRELKHRSVDECKARWKKIRPKQKRSKKSKRSD